MQNLRPVSKSLCSKPGLIFTKNLKLKLKSVSWTKLDQRGLCRSVGVRSPHVCSWLILLSVFVFNIFTEHLHAFLTETEAPVFFSKPLEDQEVTEMSRVELVCETSKPNIEVKWYKNSVEILKGKRYDYSISQNKCVLVISEAKMDDIAEFSCKMVKSEVDTMAKLLVKGRCSI